MAGNVYRAVLLGAPGSGKGTIAEKIVKKFDIIHISPGDILRQNIQEGTDLGRRAKHFMEKGQLVPNTLIIASVIHKLREIGKKSWLLDGFPRTRIQAEALQSIKPVDTVIHLIVPHEEIIQRLQNRLVHLPSGRIYNKNFNPPKVPNKDDVTGEDLVQRPDDHPDIVRNRLEVYTQTIEPVIEFYRNLGVICDFDSEKTDDIWADIEEFLDEKWKPGSC